MNPIDAAEAELQQELREMFIVDTQQNLDAYFDPLQRLNPQSWVADIQQLYRAIHTIKGGAVTVSADAMLQVAIVLEDLLSDLRYLEVAPDFADGELAQILLEAGELLSSSIEITETGDAAIAQVQPTVKRLVDLGDRVKQLYLSDWSELKQVHQEFAEQGFELVILDLEMALDKLPEQGVVPATAIDAAQATISQLTQIGVDIELAEGWTNLLDDCRSLIDRPDCQLWTAVWFKYFELLKACVKNSGNILATDRDLVSQLVLTVKSAVIAAPVITSDSQPTGNLADSLDLFFSDDEEDRKDDEFAPLDPSFSVDAAGQPLRERADENLVDLLDDFFLAEEVESIEINEPLAAPVFAAATAVNELDRESLTDDLNWHVATDRAASDEFASAIDLGFDPLPQSPIDADLDTLTQSMLSLEDISGNLATCDPEFDTFTQSEIELAEQIAQPTALDPEFDTFAQSTFEIDDFDRDLSDIFVVLNERLDEESLGSSDLSLLVERPQLVAPVEPDRLESIDSLPDLLDDFFNESDDLSMDFQALPLDRLARSVMPAESSDELDIFATYTAATAQHVAIDPAQVENAIVSTPSVPTIPAVATTPDLVAPVKRSIQIPVPLERLDKSAQHVVETLLTARAVTSISDRLQLQLNQLTTLTRENSQFVTRLRQLQDDYALLRNLSDEQQDTGNNVTLERYRQGYSTIVRLLENILRLSELGQEIESSTYQSAIRMDALDRSIVQLKDGIEASRLVPFRNLTLRSKAILRDLTNRYGKPAELIVENEHIEIDAGIVQQLEPALLHLLRNAYDHGLESVAARLAAGKPERGKIHISLQQRGNLYFLTIADDGGGIDADQIHNLAKSKGFSLNRTGTNAELLAVLCQAGFSSSSAISEVSGRGVGMDVVVAQIASIGGRLTLETDPGRGTKFAIEVPAPQLLIPCVLFQVGDRTIALPTDHVLETTLLSSVSAESSTTEIGRCNWKIASDLRGAIPGFDLHQYWQPGHVIAARTLPDTAVGIRTRQAPNTPEIWAIADDLIGQAKLLINPLPSPLIAPVGLLGVSLQPDGRLISILDPIALSAAISSTAVNPNRGSAELDAPEPSLAIAQPSAPTILIVDDAAMIRRRFESSLTTYGFITHTCNDGLEALNWLQNNPTPDLLITDVEMPNMDGFTLIDRVRQAKMELPILVVSSRASEEWGKEARRLGATDYLNKGFATSEMIQKVNSLLGLLVETQL
ncbi:response regulator [Chamaesiphon sp. OTE_75_metabat_556]|uniref:response regulator n=1 Tax=Chamaesiphon sp. OTE_75_metabat_556 TaxID=2964692 RepID=UPI00286A778A|nr:response regulator [Chamaesiphon sp. OTE_75_metabat_556]